MKINWDKKYNTIAVYAFIVVSLSILFYNVVTKLDVFTGKLNEIMGIFQPFVIGFVIAYLLNFILKFYENKVFTLKGLNKVKNRVIWLLYFFVFNKKMEIVIVMKKREKKEGNKRKW